MFTVEMRDICVAYPAVLANDHIDFDLEEGEIHILLGENGAGKTTLMNVLYGLIKPDRGEIWFQGKKVNLSSTKQAIQCGIGMVHQHFMLIPTFTVIENIVLGLPSTREPFLFLHREANKVEELSKKYGLKVNPWDRVEHLSVGEQQRVEILKALYRQAKVLILDEPTAVLAPQEIKELLAILGNLSDQGLSIIFITHKLEEVMTAGDRITVLRNGRVVGNTVPKKTTKEELATLMVGRPVIFHQKHAAANVGSLVLSVQNISASNDQGVPAVQGVSFDIHEGEIFGIAGVAGNGQEELAEIIMGLRRPKYGKVLMSGIDVTNFSPRRILQKGVAYIPPDRRKQGLILNLNVTENLMLHAIYEYPFSRMGILHDKAIKNHAMHLVKEYDIRLSSVKSLVRQLSGGNQQKVVLARELSRRPQLIVASQPTRGLDVGATEYVHHQFIGERKNKAAILLVSTELDEILELSDIIAIMFRGQIMGIIDRKNVDMEAVGLMMTGSKIGLADNQKMLERVP
jgi:simple sugar transport system ATP-binding protein